MWVWSMSCFPLQKLFGQCQVAVKEHFPCSFKLPAHLQLENLVALGRRDAEIRGDQPGSGIAATFASHIDPSLTWDFIAWMHSVTRLLIFVKVSCTAALQEQ